MIKKVTLLFCLIIIYIAAFALVARADSLGIWARPQYIKTYIQPNHAYTVMMKHAFAEWSRLTKDKIIFRYVDSAPKSQLEVYFVNRIPKGKSDSARTIGLTEGKYNSRGYMLHATIWIAEKTQQGQNLNKDEVYTTMLHEIGHSIGLEHSKDKKSAMYPGVNVIQEISKADLENLYKKYGWKN